MMKSIIHCIALFGAASCCAGEVSEVVVRQQWPWNSKVNIDYVLTDSRDGVSDMKVVLSNGTKEVTSVFGSLSGDLNNVSPGEHRIVWDPQYGSPAYDNLTMTALTATVVPESNERQYMVLDLSTGSTAETFPVTFASAPPADGWNVREYKTNKLVLRRIPAGTFRMGFTEEEVEHLPALTNTSYSSDFLSLRTATITRPFYIALFPTTTRQHWLLAGGDTEVTSNVTYPLSSGVTYSALRGANAAKESYANWPHQEADSILGRLTAKTAASLSSVLPGYRFELPTMAQWTLAARGGFNTCYANGLDWADGATNDADTNLDPIAWYRGNAAGATQPVGGKSANAFGLYDLHGNVVEIIRDLMTETKGEKNGVANPERDPIYCGSTMRRVWGCGGGANSQVMRCVIGGMQMVGTHSNNSNYASPLGYRLAFVYDAD